MEEGAWTAGEMASIPEVLRTRAEADADGPFLSFGDTHYSATEVEETSARVAAGLRTLGVQPGDRVAALLDNSIEAVLAWFGIMKAGAISVPVNTALKAGFLRHQLEDADARLVIGNPFYLERVAELGRVADLRHVVVVGAEEPDLPPFLTPHPWQAVQEADGTLDIPADADGPATIIYTAGTTGPSKGCVLSHGYMVGRSRRTQWVLDRTQDDVLFTPLPLFHVNAFQFGVIGAAVTNSRTTFAERFSVSGFWPAVRHTGATMVSLLGSLATLIARAPDHPESAHTKLRLVLAVPSPPEIEMIFRERFGVATFSGMYGQTEASPLSLVPPGTPNRPGAAGRINDLDFEVRIFDDNEGEVPCGTTGEIACRPKHPRAMFDGYWRRPETTVAATRNLWFHTGDIGKVDEDGYLYFIDRKQDYLRRRGENISSYEVEAYLLTHEAIEDVAAHAVPSQLSEDEVKVTAVLKPNASLTEEELCRFAAAGLPYFAVPRYVELRADLPRSAVGRVLKSVLRQEGVTEHTWDREAEGVTFDRR